MLEIAAVAVSVAVLACFVFLAFQCSCFGRSTRFKSFEDDSESPRERPLEGCVGPELDNTSLVNFEPLPDILSKAIPSTTALRPRITCIATDNNEPSPAGIVSFQQAFPRKQLTYLSEMGMGWFGQVVQGVADNVLVGIRQSNVIVQVLRDDASALEMQKFLQEVAGYRAIDHPNVLRLLGMCTEAIPFLILFEYFPLGDLKSYLIENESKLPMHKEKKILLHFAVDVACGLACLHRHNFVHCDLALRNCLVTNDLTVKVGDYGLAEDKYKEDYYDTGCDLLPVRWMAPETLTLQKGVWRTRAFTSQANIWSYGVSMWELIQFGRQPFHWLPDEKVLECVVLKRSEVLPVPSYPENQRINIYELMKMCWQKADQRPTIEELHGHLLDLEMSLKNMEESDFEKKWNILNPVQLDSPINGISPESMEIATDALELFVAENETPATSAAAAAASANAGPVSLNVPVEEVPLENGFTIPLASRHLLTFGDSDLVTDINTETEEKLLAQLESETKNVSNIETLLKLNPEFELEPDSPTTTSASKADKTMTGPTEVSIPGGDDSVDGTSSPSLASTAAAATKNNNKKTMKDIEEDGMPSPIPKVSPKKSASMPELDDLHLSSERVHDLSSIHPCSDESTSDSSLEISEEMADIYFQRRPNSSGLRRSNSKAMSLAPIPENGLPADNFSGTFNKSKSKLLRFNSSDDASSLQDSYEWDELVGGQLLGKSKDKAPSPRRSLDFDWSMDSDSKPVNFNRRRRHTLASLPHLGKNKEISFGKSGTDFSTSSGTGLNAYSIASEILTSRVISPIAKKTPPRRTFYTISSLNDIDIGLDDDDDDNNDDTDNDNDGLEMDDFEIPRSLRLKYSTSQDLTTVGNSGAAKGVAKLPRKRSASVQLPSTTSLQQQQQQQETPPQTPPPQPRKSRPPPSPSSSSEAFCEDLLERISSIESGTGGQFESTKQRDS
ncbi:mitogen-activated protein kinase kinase kinase 21-like isoform X1 [Argonauta hians]